MSSSKKMLLRVSMVAALGLVCAPANADDTIKIGLAVALTGEYAPYSETEGARCMAEVINEKGGVLGKKIEILVEDNRSDPQLALSIGQKFLDQGAISVHGTPFADSAIPLSQLAANYDAMVFSAQNTMVEMFEVGLDNFLTATVPDPMNGSAVASAVYGKGARKALLMKSEDGGSWSMLLPEWFGEAFTKLGGEVVGRLNHQIGTTDFSPQIAEIKAMATRPDVVYISTLQPDAGILVGQLKAAGIDAWVVGSDGFDDLSLDAQAESDKSLLDKVMFGSHGWVGTDTKLAAFIADCQKRGHDVPTAFAALGGDVVTSIAQGIEKSGSTEPAKVLAAIRGMDKIDIVTVDSYSFKDTMAYPAKPVPVIGFSGGKRVLVSMDVPSFVPYLNK